MHQFLPTLRHNSNPSMPVDGGGRGYYCDAVPNWNNQWQYNKISITVAHTFARTATKNTAADESKPNLPKSLLHVISSRDTGPEPQFPEEVPQLKNKSALSRSVCHDCHPSSQSYRKINGYVIPTPSAPTDRINIDWFLSLIPSLTAVLVGIIIPQWLQEYPT